MVSRSPPAGIFLCKMKVSSLIKPAATVILLFTIMNGIAQQKVSFDVAGIRNFHSKLNGLNVSSFYHFNEKLTGGIEVNRFFPITRTSGEETQKLSAWDFDLNFHYLLTIRHGIKCYPLTGISYTSEKEYGSNSHTIWNIKEEFFSFNTGAGILFESGRWSPHIEYSYTWGHINQQFLLAGISYELEWGHHTSQQKDHASR